MISNDTPAELPQYVIQLINKIAEKEGFMENVQIEQYAGSNHGDGFLGIMTGVKIIGKRKYMKTNNSPAIIENDSLSLICKMPPANEVRRAQFNSIEVFKREFYMYNHLLPIFDQFQKDIGITDDNGFFAYPKCYAAVCDDDNNQYVIIMNDLRANGYRMWNKVLPVNFEHTRLLMEQLGKFHAISFAIRDQKPEIFEQFRLLEDVFIKQYRKNDDAMKSVFNASLDKAITTLQPHEEYKIEKMQQLKENFLQLLTECLEVNIAEPFSVINHGDCWNNNMMYKYDGKATTPQKICLIDWQISRFGSPVLDIVYFMFSSTDSELRTAYYDRFIKIYYKNFVNTLEKLGSNPEKLFTFNDLQAQLRRFGKYGLLLAPMLVQVATSDPNEIPDLDDVAIQLQKNPEGIDIINVFGGNKTLNAYNIRMNGVINDTIRLGYY